MTPKTRAVLSVLWTLGFGLLGAWVYSSGHMTVFGFKISPVVFFGLIAAWLAYDFVVISRVFKAEESIEQEAEIAHEHAASLPRLEHPCRISITRLRSAVGAAMGVRVYLNGEAVGMLKSGTTLDLTASHASNVLKLLYDADMNEKEIDFVAESGGNLQVTLKYTTAAVTVESAAAAWYPDPDGRHQLRYWDGVTWTDHVSDDGIQSQDPSATARSGGGSAAALKIEIDDLKARCQSSPSELNAENLFRLGSSYADLFDMTGSDSHRVSALKYMTKAREIDPTKARARTLPGVDSRTWGEDPAFRVFLE